MKTLKGFEKQNEDVDAYLKPMDRIDWFLFEHIACGYVGSNFDNGTFAQNGECSYSKDGIRYYTTVMSVDGKYYYLGQAPSMEPSVYPDKERERDWY